MVIILIGRTMEQSSIRGWTPLNRKNIIITGLLSLILTCLQIIAYFIANRITEIFSNPDFNSSEFTFWIDLNMAVRYVLSPAVMLVIGIVLLLKQTSGDRNLRLSGLLVIIAAALGLFYIPLQFLLLPLRTYDPSIESIIESMMKIADMIEYSVRAGGFGVAMIGGFEWGLSRTAGSKRMAGVVFGIAMVPQLLINIPYIIFPHPLGPLIPLSLYQILVWAHIISLGLAGVLCMLPDRLAKAE
jgi:hypothetical protein